jgi:hypothetical protein
MPYHFKGSAIIAGTVYEGERYPTDERGRLFFADFIHDVVFTYHDGEASRFGSAGGWNRPVDIGTSLRGNITYLSYDWSELRELVYVGKPGSGGGNPVWLWIVVSASATVGLTAAGLALRRRARR